MRVSDNPHRMWLCKRPLHWHRWLKWKCLFKMRSIELLAPSPCICSQYRYFNCCSYWAHVHSSQSVIFIVPNQYKYNYKGQFQVCLRW
uniref:Uncharacterized protein n=1 Tax=Anguilla anguilla TaxID=7936 RepID=A0A0E9X4R0_ANGAN